MLTITLMRAHTHTHTHIHTHTHTHTHTPTHTHTYTHTHTHTHTHTQSLLSPISPIFKAMQDCLQHFQVSRKNLSHKQMLGEGAFGDVYLADATGLPGYEGQTVEVAVKQLRCESNTHTHSHVLVLTQTQTHTHTHTRTQTHTHTHTHTQTHTHTHVLAHTHTCTHIRARRGSKWLTLVFIKIIIAFHGPSFSSHSLCLHLCCMTNRASRT